MAFGHPLLPSAQSPRIRARRNRHGRSASDLASAMPDKSAELIPNVVEIALNSVAQLRGAHLGYYLAVLARPE
jgi:hypothetical protein